MNPRRTIQIILAAALGVVAIFVLPGLASAKDRNHDHIPDRWEQRHHLSLSINQAGRDQDGDRLRNRAEFLAGDNPSDRDSNDDGVMDGEENAGTIASFDAASGKLTIDLFGGETVSGLVTPRTEVKCEGAEDNHHAGEVHARRSGEAEPGDDHGGHGEEDGDDNGGHGEEPGDDNGGDNSGPGSSNSGPGNGGDDNGGANCTSADLVPGAVVQEADLEIEHGAATFDEVELAHTN